MSSGTTVKPAADIPLTELRQHPGNPRKITPARLEQLQRTLTAERDMLAARPLIALPDGTVIAGNQRLAAARALGWETIPVVYADLDEDTAARWMLLDNRPAGEDDAEMLAVMLRELGSRGVDVDLAGYLPQDVDAILRAAQPVSQRDPDDAPPAPEVPKSVRGQVYELGPHRVMCGDATATGAVAELMHSENASICITDPPYGIDFHRATWDDSSNASNLELVRSAFSLSPQSRVWTPGKTNLARDLEWNPSAKIVAWTKGFSPAGNGLGGASTWEPILVVEPPISRLKDDHLHFPVYQDKEVIGKHPTPKPVALWMELINAFSEQGDLIYEPFGGSGTTIIAAEMTGRRCFAMEFDPGYVDVIRQRYADYTNQPQYAP